MTCSHTKRNKAFVGICLYNSRHAWLHSGKVSGGMSLKHSLAENGDFKYHNSKKHKLSPNELCLQYRCLTLDFEY